MSTVDETVDNTVDNTIGDMVKSYQYTVLASPNHEPARTEHALAHTPPRLRTHDALQLDVQGFEWVWLEGLGWVWRGNTQKSTPLVKTAAPWSPALTLTLNPPLTHEQCAPAHMPPA